MQPAIARRKLMMLGSASMGGILSIVFAQQSRANTQNPPIDRSTSLSGDRAAVIDVVNGIAIFADLRDWQRCRQSFADTVEFDYTSLTGGQPATIAADQQMQNWSSFFANTFQSTQHILGSHVVSISGRTATCLSNFQAHHTYLDNQKGTWILSGYYEHSLFREGDTWKVNKMKMVRTWEDGTRPF